MADWTSGIVTIHSCPPHRVRPVLDTLKQYSLTDEDTATDRMTVNVGEPYCAPEIRVGDAIELAHDLIKCAPEMAFTVYEEPAYEWLGMTCSYVPDLGLFTADCNNGGDPMFTQTEVLQLDDEPTEIRLPKFGVPWLTAITAMPHGTVVEPDSYATHWNRCSGEVIVVDGNLCGADLLFATTAEVSAVDAALTEHGFIRANEWVASTRPPGYGAPTSTGPQRAELHHPNRHACAAGTPEPVSQRREG